MLSPTLPKTCTEYIFQKYDEIHTAYDGYYGSSAPINFQQFC
jgi:hypothetical protein